MHLLTQAARDRDSCECSERSRTGQRVTESNGQWYNARPSICITHARQGARHRQHKATALLFAIPKDSARTPLMAFPPRAEGALSVRPPRASPPGAGALQPAALLPLRPAACCAVAAGALQPAAAPRSLPRCCRWRPAAAPLQPAAGIGNAAVRVSEPYYLGVGRGLLRGGSP